MEELKESACTIGKAVVAVVAVFAVGILCADTSPAARSSSSVPTADEIKAAMPKIEEVTRDDFAALKAKKKTNIEMADTLLGYIDADDEPVAKFLIRQMAFRQYVLGSAFDKADELYSAARGEKGLEYALGIVGKSRQKLVGNASKVLKDKILVDEKATKEIALVKDQIARLPENAKLRERLALAYVAYGDWEAALLAFKDCNGEVSKVAAWELSEDRNRDDNYDAAKIAGFWWSFAGEKQASRRAISESVKIHAANWYKKALALNLLSGLDEKVAKKRIEECESFEPLPQNDPKGKDLYMIVDLAGIGSRAVSYLGEAPKDGWSDEFRTKKLVLRKIVPGSFEYMPGKSFKITKPFYIGVFEVTQKQYEMVMEVTPSGDKGDMRPVEKVSSADIRGSKKGLNWPMDDDVDNDSYVGKLRKRIGLRFDLPTDAQWEYACRAGTKGNFNVEGVELTKLGKFADNGGNVDHHDKVGSYLPNAWGLYDMHGNVGEWCLDRGRDVKETIDPKGLADGKGRVWRGGSWHDGPRGCGNSSRSGADFYARYPSVGFRLCCPVESKK